MSATISPALAAHLRGDTITLASCFRITTRGGQTHAWTTHQRPLTVGAITYAPGVLVEIFASEATSDLSVDNVELRFIPEAAGITTAELVAGVLDGATVAGVLVDYNNPGAGALAQRSGVVGAVSATDDTTPATLEVLGLSDALSASITEVHTQTCRATLGDARCKKTPFSAAGVVSAVIAPAVIAGSGLSTGGNNRFAFGKLVFTGGANAGVVAQVIESSAGRVVFDVPPPHPVAVGDSYTVQEGCNCHFETCRDRYANVNNFRGEPHIPDPNRVVIPAIRR